MVYKIYRNNNYIVVIDEKDYYNEEHCTNVLVTKNLTPDGTYTVTFIRPKSTPQAFYNIPFANIRQQSGAPYASVADWENWYTSNTGICSNNAVLNSILATLQAQTDVEGVFVKDTGNSDKIVLQVKVWDQDSQVYVATYYYDADGTLYTPVGPLEWVGSSGALEGFEDTGNSSITPLAGGATFTGAAIDIKDYAAINVAAFSNVSSATNGLRMEFSPDGINWDHVHTYSVTGNVGVSYAQAAELRYFRIVYINGATNQASFRLTTILKPTNVSPSRYTVEQPLFGGQMADVVKSVIFGKSSAGGGTYVDVKVDPSGSLETNVKQTTHDELNANVNLQVNDTDVSNANPVPVSVQSLPLPTGAATQTTLQTVATNTTGVVRTPNILRPVNTSGTISGNIYSISVANVGAGNGSILGGSNNIKPGEVLNFSADALNNFFSSFAYNATGTEFIIIYVS